MLPICNPEALTDISSIFLTFLQKAPLWPFASTPSLLNTTLACLKTQYNRSKDLAAWQFQRAQVHQSVPQNTRAAMHMTNQIQAKKPGFSLQTQTHKPVVDLPAHRVAQLQRHSHDRISTARSDQHQDKCTGLGLAPTAFPRSDQHRDKGTGLSLAAMAIP